MRSNGAPTRSSQPSLLDIYHAAQNMQYGPPVPPVAAPQREVPKQPKPLLDLKATHADTPRLSEKAGAELRKHPLRYGVAGVAAIAITAFALQTGGEGKTTHDEISKETSVMTVGEGDASNDSKEQTGDPDKITFASLLGARIELGSLQTNTIGGSGHIIYARTDNATGTIDLPNITHQQHIEVYAQPLLVADQQGIYTASTPISVTPKDSTYLVQVDRSKVGVVFDYAMPGTYKTTTDKDKVTTVSLSADEEADAFTMSFLPTNAKPLSTSKANAAQAEVTRANLLATASDQMATTEAKVIALKQSINAIQSILSNGCFANPTDTKPTDTTSLITQKLDTTLKTAVEKWAKDNHRTLYLNITGEYPLNSESTLQQYIASAAGGDAAAKENARDIETITTNRYSRYFGASAVKMTCNPDAKIMSQG